MECDYLIVGAGSSGCVLANRLSADGKHRVILLEAGGRDRSPWIHIPVGYFKTMGNPSFDWLYKTEHDPGLNGRSIPWPRGKVLGGSSSINGLLYVRGQPEDYDRWASLGNEGWDWQGVEPYFRRLEDWQGTPDPARGQGGPMKVSPSCDSRPIVAAWLEAAERAGYPRNPDYNVGAQEGVGFFQQTACRGRRWSAAVGYVRPAEKRDNLTVITHAQAERIVIGNGMATGVRTVDGRTFRARREVVLSAGAIGSPQLLTVSGIGDHQTLSSLGIETIQHAPDVGRNLQDHLQARPVYCTDLATVNVEVRNPWRKMLIGLEYLLRRTGSMTMAASLGTGFLATRYGAGRPDIQYHIQPFSADHPALGPHHFSAFTASVLQMRPESRGHLKFVSADVRTAPEIHPNYLDAELDCQTIVEALRITRRIAETPPLDRLITAAYSPGEDINPDDDASLLDWVRDTATTIYHPVGTCRMGGDQDSVVDSELRVRGVANLRVADAAIMPEITSGNTNAPCLMIGEKASDLILAAAAGKRIL